MSILKSISTLVIIFMLSLFVVSCGGGGGGSGGGTSPATIPGGDGNGGNANMCPAGQTRVNGQCVAQVAECPSGQTRVNGQCVTPQPQQCPSGQTGTPPNCLITIDSSMLTNTATKFTDASTDGGGVIFEITRDGSSNETRRLYAVQLDRTNSFIVSDKDDPNDTFGIEDRSRELDTDIGNGIFRDYTNFSTGGHYSSDYRFYRELGITGVSGNGNRVFVEFKGYSGNAFAELSWITSAYGPALSALPTGSQTYKGATLAVPERSNYDGRDGQQGVSNRPFTMSVNFGTGVGEINPDTTTALTTDQIDLIGAFTVDLATGTFSVETG